MANLIYFDNILNIPYIVTKLNEEYIIENSK
jgi:hypothetical protein